jgi:hypothetical protein
MDQMTDEPGGFYEPPITINGYKLTTAQAMTLRVALQTFGMSLAQSGLGNDANGLALTKAYTERAREINAIYQKAEIKPIKTP